MSADVPAFCDLAVPGVQHLQPYQPGKPESELAREYGVSDIVKLASNESPLGPAPSVVAAIEAAARTVHRYPDGNAFELKQRLASRHDLAPEWITVGNGSNDVLDMVARAFLGPGRQAVFARHAFAVYPIATQTVGAEAVVTPANGPDHPQPYGHDLDAMAAAVTEQTAVVFVANPNNPTGTWLTGPELEAFLEQVPRRVVVVLDEAYFEFAGDCEGYPDGTRWLERHPNLVITRTFSKAYGIAGLRVGYALCRPEIADLLNRVRHPFNVSIIAQAAADAAVQATDHTELAIANNAAERTRLADALAAMGMRVLPSAGNFLCVEPGGEVSGINEQLLRRGVIVRPVGGYGLPSFIRVSIGLPKENDRFLAALGEIRGAGEGQG